MYSNYELCPDLRVKEKCIRTRRYSNGTYTDLNHFHVPSYRLKKVDHASLLKVLVAFETTEVFENYVRCFLNSRGKAPAPLNLSFAVEYPEPGVIRTYCGGDFCAWIDEVIVPNEFRKMPARAEDRR